MTVHIIFSPVTGIRQWYLTFDFTHKQRWLYRKNMESGRFLAEITTVRKKYNCAVFDLEKSKENEKLLLTKNGKLIEELEECKKKVTSVQEKNEKISLQLQEALKKIELLSGEKSEQLSPLKQANEVTKDKKSPVADKISLLQNQNSVLEARLKQMELGIEQNKRFVSQNQQEHLEKNDDADADATGFDIEEILGHRKKGSTYLLHIRWKDYGPEDDTWEPKSNLQCKNCKIVNAYLKKNNI